MSQPPRGAIGCVQPPTWGWSFYSSFGGLTKKFRTNLGQKRRSSSFHSSLGYSTKKFRTIAGQRLPTTYRRKLRGKQSRAIEFELSRTIGPTGSASGRSNSSNSASCGNTTAQRPTCQICLSAKLGSHFNPTKSPRRWVVRNRRPGAGLSILHSGVSRRNPGRIWPKKAAARPSILRWTPQ
ncbi:hypothetical protein CCANI_12060 [Corynebacterium canis]|nr:hypothetical protein CCANI_12060 [Corynebacterium canis]